MRIQRRNCTVKDGLRHFECSRQSRARRPGSKFPTVLWFRIPERFEHSVADAIEPFVVALSSLASARNEAMHIEGPFSERLSLGLDEYWKVMTLWEPKEFSHFRLTGAAAEAGNDHARSCGGGSLLGRRRFILHAIPRSGAARRIPHQIRDVRPRPRYSPGRRRHLRERGGPVRAATRCEGVELVRVKSNVRAFVPAGKWEMAHGSILAVRRSHCPRASAAFSSRRRRPTPH